MAKYRVYRDAQGMYTVVGLLDINGVLQLREVGQKADRSTLQATATDVANKLNVRRKELKAVRDGGGWSGVVG